MIMSSMNTTDEDRLQPEEIVSKYYQAFYTNGDLKSVKALMTEESYYMTLEPFGMGLSIKKRELKIKWDTINKTENQFNK